MTWVLVLTASWAYTLWAAVDFCKMGLMLLQQLEGRVLSHMLLVGSLPIIGLVMIYIIVHYSHVTLNKGNFQEERTSPPHPSFITPGFKYHLCSLLLA